MRWSLVLLVFAACVRQPPEPAGAQRSAADLDCPSGTRPAGDAPPAGYEAWCHRGLPDGTWVRQGPAITWHPNGQRASQGAFEAGERTGVWEFFYPTGQLERRGTYAGGVENGAWTAYHPDGALRSEGEMVGGQPHGTWTYWELDGRRVVGSWVLGQRDGVWVEHGPDDQPTAERSYKSGRMVGMREL